MNVWPASLPQRCEVDTYSETTGDGRALFDNDLGDFTARQRVSYVPSLLSVSFLMDHTQAETLDTFIRTTLKRVLPFQLPAQRGAGTWVVKLGKNMPTASGVAPLLLRVSMDLVRLPQ